MEDEIPQLLPLYSHTTKIPVTIITGFLGSGKTTLLNYILTHQHGKRIAVILNEYEQASQIDQCLLNIKKEDHSVLLQEWIELNNGCMCCTVKDSGVAAIENLLKKNRNTIDYILIETAGLADPYPIINAFWMDEQLESQLILDGIITVVDTKNIQLRIETGIVNETMKQLAIADRIILNKKDLVSEENLADTMRKLKSMNELAKIHVTERAIVPLDFMLDIRAFDLKNLTKELCYDSRYDDHQHHERDKEIHTIWFDVIGDIELATLNSWLQSLLWNKMIPETKKPVDIIRIKGSFSIKNEAYICIAQGIYELYDTQFTLPWSSIHERKNKLFIIGRHLEQQELFHSFKATCNL